MHEIDVLHLSKRQFRNLFGKLPLQCTDTWMLKLTSHITTGERHGERQSELSRPGLGGTGGGGGKRDIERLRRCAHQLDGRRIYSSKSI